MCSNWAVYLSRNCRCVSDASDSSFLPGLHPSLQLMTQTRDLALAQQWLALLPALEGVVAKKSDGHYAPGRRDWVKVKRQRTVDCVVIGLAGDAVNPALVLGLRHADGVLHHLGRLGGVICHLERNRRTAFDSRQRLFRRHRTQEKCGIL